MPSVVLRVSAISSSSAPMNSAPFGSHRFHLFTEAAPSVGQRIALQLGEVRGQGVSYHARRRPNTATVEMH